MSLEHDQPPSASTSASAIPPQGATDIETESPSRYVWFGVLTIALLTACCVAAFWLLSRSAMERDVVPTPPPGSRARVEVSGPLALGALFGVRGSGFQANEAVEIFLSTSPTASFSEFQRLGDAIAGPDGTFQRNDLTAPTTAGQYYLIARGAASGFTQFTPVAVSGDRILTQAPPEAPTLGPAGPLPDLVIASVAIELETGSSCAYVSPQLGIRAVVQNIGSAPAGPFIVQANNQQQLVPNGLAPGQTDSRWFPGFTTGSNLVVVDPTNMVVESDKGNNTFNGPLPIPTLPATCTPPPSPTLIALTATPNPNLVGAWYGQYFGNPDLIPPVLFDQNLPGPPLNVNWGTAAPNAGVPRNNWSAIFTSDVNFPTTDNYQFTLSVDGGARVFVDEVLIINQWFSAGLRTITADVSLTAGPHSLRVEYYKSGGSARISLNWRVSYAGWEGRYYNSPNLTGPVIIKRDDPPASPNPPGFLNTASMPNWPPPQVNPFNFSADWRRSVNFPASGTYVFTATVDDGARLLIDGAIVAGIDNFTAGPKVLVGTRVLNAGQHFLQVQYVNYTGPGNIELVWAFVPPPPTATPTPTPTPTDTPTSTATLLASPSPTPTLIIIVTSS